MKARFLGGVALAACLLTLVHPAPAVADHPPGAPLIQPGEYSESGDAGCTLSFVYDGGGSTYVGTAAHCVERVGDNVKLSDGTVFGKVAVMGDEDATETDWALIKVDTEDLHRVSPAVKGNPTVPTGVTSSSQTAFGDQVVQSGYGMGFDLTAPTRERRTGVLTYDDAQLYTVVGAFIFGDSGGPVVHQKTGKALGIVSRLCIGICEMEGPTVEGILAQAGLNLTLRTV